jgi:hypothetical protein
MDRETVSVKTITVLWDVALRNLVETDRRFRGVYCLHQAMTKSREKVGEDLGVVRTKQKLGPTSCQGRGD